MHIKWFLDPLRHGPLQLTRVDAPGVDSRVRKPGVLARRAAGVEDPTAYKFEQIAARKGLSQQHENSKHGQHGGSKHDHGNC